MAPWCDRCERSFPHQSALNQHFRDSYVHNYCFRCDRDFVSPSALAQHKANSSSHNICRKCGKDFSDTVDLDEHIEDSHWHCERCDTFTNSEDELKDHYARSSAHHYCRPCERFFQNDNNLRAHLRSTLHAGGTIKCIGCTRTFPTISAMTLHLESGTCPSGATRQKVNETVRHYDRNNLITDRLLTYPDSNGRTDTWATGAAWNGYAFACYFCPREFQTLTALNQHLKSPAHEQKLYHCPKCGVKFNVFSGLVQHVESESCGIARFREVKNVMDRMTSGLSRMITY